MAPRLVKSLGLLLVLVTAAGAAEQPAAAGAPAIDAQAEVAAVLYAASATQAAQAKLVDARLRALRARIEALAAEAKAGDLRHRAEMTSAQQAFVAQLAARDREYAAQIALFRSTVTDIASTPEGASALERFNAGDEVGALAILDRLRDAHEQMRAERARLEHAAEGRRIARLALEARTRGKVTTADVIRRFEEVVGLDARVVDDWAALVELYTDAGRLDDALQAVTAHDGAAQDDSQRANGFRLRSDVLQAQGDNRGSRAAAEQAVTLLRRMAAADRANVDIETTLSRALISFGYAARRQGDLAAAEKAYVEDIGIRRRYLASDPANDFYQLRLTGSLLHLVDVLIARGNDAGARSALEEILAIQRQRAKVHPESVVVPRQTAVTLMWLSDVLVNQGDFEAARKANAEIVATATRLSAADAANAVLKRDLVYGYSKTAWLQRIEGDFDASLKSYEDTLAISRGLAQGPSAAMNVRVDVGTWLTQVSLIKFLQRDFDGSLRAAEEATSILRALVAVDPTDVQTRLFLAGALNAHGAALAAKGELEAARKAHEESIAIDRRLLQQTPENADAKYDLSIAHLELGRLASRRSDPAEALAQLRPCLDLRTGLAAAAPGNASLQRAVAEVMRELAELPDSPVDWAAFRAHVEDMERRRILWPSDRAWLEDARRRVATKAAT